MERQQEETMERQGECMENNEELALVGPENYALELFNVRDLSMISNK